MTKRTLEAKVEEDEDHDSGSDDEKDRGEGGAESEDVKERKRRERLEQNRISARESRKRKKTMIEELQRTVITLSRENKELNDRNENLRRQLMEIGAKYPNIVPLHAIMGVGGAAAAGQPTAGGAADQQAAAAAAATSGQPAAATMPQAAAAPTATQQGAMAPHPGAVPMMIPGMYPGMPPMAAWPTAPPPPGSLPPAPAGASQPIQQAAPVGWFAQYGAGTPGAPPPK